jgi:hypothetical protein
MMRKGENGKKRAQVRGGLAKPGKYGAWAKECSAEVMMRESVCRETERGCERERDGLRESGFETSRERETERERERETLNVPLNEREKKRLTIFCGIQI